MKRDVEVRCCDVLCGSYLYIWKDQPEQGVVVSFAERPPRDLRAAGSLRDSLGSGMLPLTPESELFLCLASESAI